MKKLVSDENAVLDVGRAILPAAGFRRLFRARCESSLPERRLKAGGSQDWLPHRAAAPQPKIKEPGVDTSVDAAGRVPAPRWQRIVSTCEDFEEL
jgi:hypothetical protein